MPLMDVSYPQALFSTLGMTSVFVVMVVIQLLSLGFLLIASYEFRRTMRKHNAFLRVIDIDDKHDEAEHTSHVIFWIYLLSTLVATAVTTLLFMYQPHLL